MEHSSQQFFSSGFEICHRYDFWLGVIGIADVAILIRNDITILEALPALHVPMIFGVFVSIGFAIAVGKAETGMLLRHGI